MCNHLQLTSTERLRTEAALRKELGTKLEGLLYTGFIRQESVKKLDDKPVWLPREGRKGTRIIAIHSVPILSFAEKSKWTGNPVWFDSRGSVVVLVHEHRRYRPHLCFSLLTKTAGNPAIRDICKKDRQPYILPEGALLSAVMSSFEDLGGTKAA